jgi:hypothetical protein
MRSRLPLASLLLVAVSAGCAGKESAPETPEIAILERDLAREFRSTVPQVEMEDSTLLAVSFDDPGLARMSRDEKDATAQKVMEYVRDNYSPYERLTAVKVAFASRSRRGPLEFGHHTTFTKNKGAIGEAVGERQ